MMRDPSPDEIRGALINIASALVHLHSAIRAITPGDQSAPGHYIGAQLDDASKRIDQLLDQLTEMVND